MKYRKLSFPKRIRLNTITDYQWVFSKPIKLYDKYFILILRENNFNYARLGFAISRKNIKTAVNRNRIRRMVRESFRMQQENLAYFDIVVIARAKAADASVLNISRSIVKHWEKVTR